MGRRAALPDDGHTPCLGCECCHRWTVSLELMRAHARRHVESEIRIEPCSEDCLICEQIDWQGRG